MNASWRWKLAQFWEIRWWKQYFSGKNKAEYLAWKSRYWQGFLEKIHHPIPPDTTVLDAGCGPAGIFIALPHATVHAVDPLLDQYRAKALFLDPADYPNVCFYAQKIEDFYLDNFSVDLVFCLNALNHVARIDQAAQKLVAHLKPGGCLVLSVDAHAHAWLKPVFQRLAMDILHPHQLAVNDYRALFTEMGMVLEQEILLKPGTVFHYYLLVFRKPA